ncbi:DUF6281 family protein [Streptomyces anulatus]|uniref:DUF6281 family protein n=1 Tax=Streptomyces anulatus TaxID=1892 RepID=UPI0022587332|nr:DUF6281 family protein [Streptomyces anulatus]MCX4523332.1 DUF6281 family protein [Streptomyces anulatus]MCX4606342.1 DUF6281 family protein [Streptomyces anulatus]
MTGKQAVSWTVRGRFARSVSVRSALAAGALFMSTSCAGAGATQGGAGSSCAALLEYEGHTYLGHGLYPYDEGDSDDVRAGRRLGAGTIPGCDDTPNEGDQKVTSETVTVYAVEGVDPVHAVTVDHPAGGTLYIEQASKKTLPELRTLIEAQESDAATQ